VVKIVEFLLLTTESANVLSTIRQLFTPLIEFFIRYGEIGLFIYSIIETITPIAGVEVVLLTLVGANPERWWILTINLVSANTIGAIFVYFFMAKEDNKIYNRFVSKKQQKRGKEMFDRYGFWAIFIFAMTPLPFFVIVFTAAIAKMRFLPYVLAAFLSRGIRFSITAYMISLAALADEDISLGWIVFWLGLIGVSISLLMMFIQKKILERAEKKKES